MSMDEILFNLLKAVIIAATSIITYYVVPYLKAQAYSTRYADVIKEIDKQVRAYEQIIKDTGMGAKKKQEVVKAITEFCRRIHFNMTEEQISQLIEAAVYQLKTEGQKAEV